MLRGIGQSVDVHHIDAQIVGECIDELRGLSHGTAKEP
jgi:hypothetical protein